MQILVDQIVIDCHWLHCRKETVIPKWASLRDRFDPTLPFDAIAISIELGQHDWKRDFRAGEFLVLTLRQQHQLLMLCTEEVRDARRDVFDGYRKGKKGERVKAEIGPIRLAVRAWSEKVHRIRGHQEMYEALWAARRLLANDGLKKHWAELAGFIVGRPAVDGSTLTKRFASLDKALAGLVGV